MKKTPTRARNKTTRPAVRAAKKKRASADPQRERKLPTSIALTPSTIDELRSRAAEQGIPYQVFMRSLVIEGLSRLEGTKRGRSHRNS